MDIDFGDIIKKVDKEFERTNILVLGKTGVGKSTLINAIFGEDLAKTGAGKPCTEDIKEYSKEGHPIHLIDTKGLELENYDEILDGLMTEILVRKRSTDSLNHVHIAWYCINKGSRRIEDGEINIIKTLSKEIPVIVVLTQSIDEEQEFINKVEDLFKGTNADVIEVLAQPYKCRGGEIKTFGLKELASKTNELLPKAHKSAFIAAQKVDMELKEKKCQKIIVGAATAAATAAATPIPFSDALVLAPIQISMLAGISLAMGLSVSRSFLTTLVTSAAGVMGASYTGRVIVSNLIKLIPGGGTLVGGAIAAGTAGALTTTMGFAYLKALKISIASGQDLTPGNIAATFRSTLAMEKVKS